MLLMKSTTTPRNTRMPRPNQRWPLPNRFVFLIRSRAAPAARPRALKRQGRLIKDELRSFGIGIGNYLLPGLGWEARSHAIAGAPSYVGAVDTGFGRTHKAVFEFW